MLTFLKDAQMHMFHFLCSTMNGPAVLAWRLDLEFSLLSVVEKSRGSPALTEHILSEAAVRWHRTILPLLFEVREEQKCCQLIDLPSSQTPWAVTPIIGFSIRFYLTQDLSLCHNVFTHPENGSFIVQAACTKAASSLQPCLQHKQGRDNSTGAPH